MFFVTNHTAESCTRDKKTTPAHNLVDYRGCVFSSQTSPGGMGGDTGKVYVFFVVLALV